MVSGGFDRLDGDGLALLDLVFADLFCFVVSMVGVFYNAVLIGAPTILSVRSPPSVLDA